MYRSTAERRKKMMSCGARTSQKIRTDSERKLSDSAPGSSPRKVDPALKNAVVGWGKGTGMIADIFGQLASACGTVIVGVSSATARACGERMQPVMHSEAGLALSCVGGNALASCGNLIGGSAGAAYQVVSAKSVTSQHETQHKHGDEYAEMMSTSVGSIENTVRAAFIVTSSGASSLAMNAGMDAATNAARQRTAEMVAKHEAKAADGG